MKLVSAPVVFGRRSLQKPFYAYTKGGYYAAATYTTTTAAVHAHTRSNCLQNLETRMLPFKQCNAMKMNLEKREWTRYDFVKKINDDDESFEYTYGIWRLNMAIAQYSIQI